jgi:hypothetical protein
MVIYETTIRRLVNKEFDVEVSYTDLSFLKGVRVSMTSCETNRPWRVCTLMPIRYGINIAWN